jgi:Ca2+/Na+ antiporter
MRNKTEEEKDLEMRKDIFWRNFYFLFFVCILAYGWLNKLHLATETIGVALVGFWIAGVLFLPAWWYKQKWVQEQYDIFQNKKWKTATDEKERAKAKLYYNLAIYFLLVVFSWIASGAIAEFVFDKNNTIRMIINAVLIIVSVVFSIWLTEKKSKQPTKSGE